MNSGKLALLPDRGAVSITGPDAEKLLQGLITQDMDSLAKAPSLFAALLSPQGKILFEFFVLPIPGGYLLDVSRERAADLVKRLMMYKLRAKVDISDQGHRYRTFAFWGDDEVTHLPANTALSYSDPRHSGLGFRILSEGSHSIDIDETTTVSTHEYDALRVDLTIPQGGHDYAFADITPHEANFDRLNGVSFTKGCYVGQEVVARMHNKTVVRKRIVQVNSTSTLTSASDIRLGEAVIGKIGTVDGRRALALLRLDRALEAMDKGIELSADGHLLSVDPNALASYRTASTARGTHPGLAP